MMFASVLIGFIAGMIAAMVVVVMSGNPRADQLEAELAGVRDEIYEEFEDELRFMRLRNTKLQERLSSCLEALISWEKWAGIAMREMPRVENHTEDEGAAE